MPSFDMVSEVDEVELRHAAENTERELATRFDFRGVEASVSFDKGTIVLKTEADFQSKQLRDMLRGQLVKRQVDPNTMDTSDGVSITGKTCTQVVKFKQGIEQDMAKKIVKLIKAEKLKVQAAIQGEKVRVTGKKRDDLQAAMALVRKADLGQPFQFENFRD